MTKGMVCVPYEHNCFLVQLWYSNCHWWMISNLSVNSVVWVKQ
jgi:hypothetical protein